MFEFALPECCSPGLTYTRSTRGPTAEFLHSPFPSRSPADIHIERNCSGSIVISEGPGCGCSADKRTAIPGVATMVESARPVALGGSHKLNAN